MALLAFGSGPARHRYDRVAAGRAAGRGARAAENIVLKIRSTVPPLFFINLWSGSCQKWGGKGGSGGPHGRARDSSDAQWFNRPMLWGGSTKISANMGVHTARKTPYLGGNPGKHPKSRNFAPSTTDR
jgi:hypothetical protein